MPRPRTSGRPRRRRDRARRRRCSTCSPMPGPPRSRRSQRSPRRPVPGPVPARGPALGPARPRQRVPAERGVAEAADVDVHDDNHGQRATGPPPGTSTSSCRPASTPCRPGSLKIDGAPLADPRSTATTSRRCARHARAGRAHCDARHLRGVGARAGDRRRPRRRRLPDPTRDRAGFEDRHRRRSISRTGRRDPRATIGHSRHGDDPARQPDALPRAHLHPDRPRPLPVQHPGQRPDDGRVDRPRQPRRPTTTWCCTGRRPCCCGTRRSSGSSP